MSDAIKKPETKRASHAGSSAIPGEVDAASQVIERSPATKEQRITKSQDQRLLVMPVTANSTANKKPSGRKSPAFVFIPKQIAAPEAISESDAIPREIFRRFCVME